jgi:hypothetical protein
MTSIALIAIGVCMLAFEVFNSGAPKDAADTFLDYTLIAGFIITGTAVGLRRDFVI